MLRNMWNPKQILHYIHLDEHDDRILNMFVQFIVVMKNGNSTPPIPCSPFQETHGFRRIRNRLAQSTAGAVFRTGSVDTVLSQSENRTPSRRRTFRRNRNATLARSQCEATCTSVLEHIELLAELCSVRGDDEDASPSSLRSVDVDDLRPTPTRSLAMRDHDSRRLCVSQQAAGPRPPFIVRVVCVGRVSVYTSRNGLMCVCVRSLQRSQRVYIASRASNRHLSYSVHSRTDTYTLMHGVSLLMMLMSNLPEHKVCYSNPNKKTVLPTKPFFRERAHV